MIEKKIRRYSDEFRRRVVSELEAGKMSIIECHRTYGVDKTSLRDWLREYGRYQPKRSIVEVVMKDEREKIAELEKALAEAHLKIRFYDELISIASEEYKTDLKKTFGTGPLRGSKPKESR